MIDRVCYGPLAAAFSDPTTASDTSIAPYADAYFEYDWVRRVSKAVVQGAGCSSCSSGVGTFTMIYDFSISADGYNNWRNKTTTNLPDGGVETTYTNAFGEVMLDSSHDAAGEGGKTRPGIRASHWSCHLMCLEMRRFADMQGLSASSAKAESNLRSILNP